MNRRQWMAGTGGVIGSVAAVALPGRRLSGLRAAQTPAAVEAVDAFGAKIAAGAEVELREGVTVRFVGVTRDNRCPANVQCVVAGSAGVLLAFSLADDRQNIRTFDEEVEFPRGRKVLIYDTDALAIVADLSGDSDVDGADLVLSLYLVVTDV